MADEKEPFLARWSRLKREKPSAPARELPAKAEPEKPVPPLESLTPDSDFSVFMQPNVKEELRRLALKKMFRDPHFNVPDPFEPFSGDWTAGEAIPGELLAKLSQARTLLLTPEERAALDEQEKAQKQTAQQEMPEKETKADEPGQQET